MKSQVLHTACSGENAGEIRNWSLLGVKGLSQGGGDLKLLQCIRRNLNCAQGKRSLHSRWDVILTSTALHGHGDARWPTEVTSPSDLAMATNPDQRKWCRVCISAMLFLKVVFNLPTGVAPVCPLLTHLSCPALANGTAKCISKAQLCDFRKDCWDGSDESDCGNFTRCDFQSDLCGWITSQASQMRWQRHRNGTPSIYTGQRMPNCWHGNLISAWQRSLDVW